MRKTALVLIGILFLVLPVLAADLKTDDAPHNFTSMRFSTFHVEPFISTSNSWSAESQTGQGIAQLELDLSVGGSYNITVRTLSGATYYVWTRSTPPDSFIDVVSDIYVGDPTGESFKSEFGQSSIVTYRIRITGATRTGTTETGILIYKMDAWADLYHFQPAPLGSDYITSVYVSCPSGYVVSGKLTTAPAGSGITPYQEPQEQIGRILGISEILAFLNEFGGFALLIITAGFYWLKFIFIDNFYLTVGMYITLTAAIAFAGSQDIFTALKKWFRYQERLYEFLMTIVQMVIDVLTRIVDAIKPV